MCKCMQQLYGSLSLPSEMRAYKMAHKFQQDMQMKVLSATHKALANFLHPIDCY